MMLNQERGRVITTLLPCVTMLISLSFPQEKLRYSLGTGFTIGHGVRAMGGTTKGKRCDLFCFHPATLALLDIVKPGDLNKRPL